MRVIWDKISEEYKRGVALRNFALGLDSKEGIELRKEQQKSWEKFNWLKKLNNAIEKQKKVDKMIELEKETLERMNKECGFYYEKEKGKILIEDVPDIIEELLLSIEERDLEINRLNSFNEDDDADEYYENMKMECE